MDALLAECLLEPACPCQNFFLWMEYVSLLKPITAQTLPLAEQQGKEDPIRQSQAIRGPIFCTMYKPQCSSEV